MSETIAEQRTGEDEEDFVREAAYNLQQIYVVAGNSQLALEITQKHLVI